MRHTLFSSPANRTKSPTQQMKLKQVERMLVFSKLIYKFTLMLNLIYYVASQDYSLKNLKIQIFKNSDLLNSQE